MTDPRAVRLVLAALIGLGLIVTGGIVAVGVGVPGSLPLFGPGFGLLFVLSSFRRRDEGASPAVRRAARLADAVLSGSLLAGVLVVANVLAFRYGERPIDWTHDRSFSLAPLTVQQVRELARPVRFTVFFGNSPVASRQGDRIVQLLELYRAIQPRLVRVESLSRYTDPDRFQELARRVPEVPMTPGGGVVVELGEGDAARRVVVRLAEMFEVAPSQAPDQLAANFLGEDVLTSALIRLREDDPLRVGFTTGHGEPALEDAQDPAAIGLFRSRLTAYGAQVQSVNLVSGPVPDGLDVLVSVRPQTPFDVREAQRLKDFLARGGRLVLLVDGGRRTGLEDWLASFRIEVGSRPIVDPRYNFTGRPDLPLAPIGRLDTHPITRALTDQAIVVPSAVALNLNPETARPGDGPVSASARPFLQTSPTSRLAGTQAESGPAGNDRGPFVVGLALTEIPRSRGQAERPLMVVLGSPGLANNDLALAAPANQDLLVNALAWLRGRETLVGIAPKTHITPLLVSDPSLRTRLVLLPSILALTVLIGLGVFVHLARRS